MNVPVPVDVPGHGNPGFAGPPTGTGTFTFTEKLAGLVAAHLAGPTRERYSGRDMDPNDITTLLGPGTQFEGKLHFEGRVRIDGAFKGEIRSDDTLIIGEGADVHAEIDVATVIVRGGTVHGNVRAKQSIEVHAPGRLIGNIHSPSVFIERGVEFQGNCRMDALDAPKAVAAAPVAQA